MGPRTAHKLAPLRNTESQRITPEKGEVSASNNGAKVNTDLMRGLQPTKAIDQKQRHKSTSEISRPDVKKEAALSNAGAKWYLRYLKKCLHPEEILKKTQGGP